MKKSFSIIPLGGLGEIGLNMMVLQWGSKALIVDCGVMFSDGYTPGIDLMVPDFQYVFDEKIDVVGVVLTHGHEDHIGALPFFLRKRPVPVYGTPFTIELVHQKLQEQGLLSNAKLCSVQDGETLSLDPFQVEWIRVNHSIPDATALGIDTPVGKVIHTGDFKMDETPTDGRTTDLKRFQELGDEGVLLLLSDSTNVEVPGKGISEQVVRGGIEELLQSTQGWFVLSSFSSHIPRIRQVLELASQHGRKVHVMGRSMIQNVSIARKLGYLTFPDDLFVNSSQAKELHRNQLVILSSGSQGEPRSALVRLALDQNKELKLQPGDEVVLSSRFIPGNERAIFSTMNHLYRRGAEVHTTRGADVHVSGHACREDLRQMLLAVRPKFFIPVHGEYRHLVKHLQLAQEVGILEDRKMLLENGDRVEIRKDRIQRMESIPVGRSVVDGREVADIGTSIVKDRRDLSQTGLVVVVTMIDSQSGDVVRGPELFSKGVAFENQMEDLLEEAQKNVRKNLEELSEEARTDIFEVQETIRLTIRRFFKNRLDRKPVTIPIVIEV